MFYFLSFRSFKLWLIITFKILKRNIFWLILSLILITLSIFLQIRFKVFQDTNTISLGFIGTYQEHDLPLEVLNLISEPIAKSDDSGKFLPNLVTGWETNNDATNFKFKLKDDLKWADGSTVSSKDLVFAIPNVEVKLPDEKIIEFNLKEPYSPLPSLMTKPILKKDSMMGVGPYIIKGIDKSRIFITKIELNPVDKKLPKVFIRFYPTEKVAITGFNLGEVQALFGFSSSSAFSSNPTATLRQRVDYSKIVSILFQTKDPLLSNRSLRQALGFITPKIEGEEVADNPYPPKSWAYDPDAKKYLSNPGEAKEAMNRAKSSIPEEKIMQELILTTTPNLEEAGNKIIREWKSLGLDAKLRVESGIAQNFQSLLITQSIPIDPDQYSLWHATQDKTNLTKYDSKRADKDLEDGRKVINEEERKEKYIDFQKTLLEDAPAIFLYFPKYNIAYLKKKEELLDKILSLTNN